MFKHRFVNCLVTQDVCEFKTEEENRFSVNKMFLIFSCLSLSLQVCSKVFGNASALAKHKLTHSDERKYVCGMCSKAFKRQDHL